MCEMKYIEQETSDLVSYAAHTPNTDLYASALPPAYGNLYFLITSKPVQCDIVGIEILNAPKRMEYPRALECAVA
jgi:hypothetical protein